MVFGAESLISVSSVGGTTGVTGLLLPPLDGAPEGMPGAAGGEGVVGEEGAGEGGSTEEA